MLSVSSILCVSLNCIMYFTLQRVSKFSTQVECDMQKIKSNDIKKKIKKWGHLNVQEASENRSVALKKILKFTQDVMFGFKNSR